MIGHVVVFCLDLLFQLLDQIGAKEKTVFLFLA